KNFFLARNAERERVDERILRIARLEAHFAADCRHAETVAVVADAADDSVEDSSIRCNLEVGSKWRVASGEWRDKTFFGDGPETERIEHGYRPRAHCKDVAQDSADAGRRALKWFNVARMIVRFDFERGNEASTDIHNAGIFSGAL